MVAEMAAVQEANQMRPVQGIIFFGYNNLRPADGPLDSRGAGFSCCADVVDNFERETPRTPAWRPCSNRCWSEDELKPWNVRP